MDTDKLQKTTKAFYDILMDFHLENADVYPRENNWHKDFINMDLVIKALEKTYADSGQDVRSRWFIFSGELTKLNKEDRLFVKYDNKDFPPTEHKKQIMSKFTYEFLSINGLRLTTKIAEPVRNENNLAETIPAPVEAGKNTNSVMERGKSRNP